ncbi:hypothetical protein [Methylocapsa sp. S129]|uniref:hypothetical protein n=1 Tax=Methylocapsa sp. S129 TaxID=1641869 RepID=UPI00131A8477|nr:hypothetical protein [Methylocapsa sp. S129]
MVARTRRAAIAAIAALAVPAMLARCQAADWPPVDPGEPRARVALTAEWVAGLRGLRSFQGLQDAIGARGRIIAFETKSETPRVVYSWTGAAQSGRMRAFVYRDGGFAAVVTLKGGGEAVLNNFGAFVCPICAPPVDACGERPSWVPHDLHWDNFDCAHTITGPQSLYPQDP